MFGRLAMGFANVRAGLRVPRAIPETGLTAHGVGMTSCTTHAPRQQCVAQLSFTSLAVLFPCTVFSNTQFGTVGFTLRGSIVFHARFKTPAS